MTVLIGIIEATADSTMESDGRLNKSYHHVYLYRTDALTRPTFADIDADLGIAPGSPYGDDLSAVAGKISISHRMTRPPHCAAEVSVTWATNNPTLPEAADGTNPVNGRVLWQIRVTSQSTYTTEDRNGKMIKNGAGTPFDGGAPVTKYFGVAEARVSIADADFDYASVYRDSGSLNSEEFLGAAPGTLQVEISADEHIEGAAHWWDVRYTFTYNELGHQPRILNAGFYRLDSSGDSVPIRLNDLTSIIEMPPSDDNPKVIEPEPLTVDGHVVLVANRPDGCNYIEVDWHPTKDFNDFGLI